MENPNPIYYKDLITPDNSITQLISQLKELVAEYDGAKSKIQGAANDVAKSLQGVSGATEEQRKTIQQAAVETEKLAKEYLDIRGKSFELTKALNEAAMAKKENAQVDKLLTQIMTSAEGSYNKLSAQYRLNKIRLNEMSLAEREGTEAGRQLEVETNALYEEMKRLQEVTGKHQLNVGNYADAAKGLRTELMSLTQQMALMKMNGEGNSQAYQELAQRAGTLKDAMADAQREVKGLSSDTQTLDATMNAASATSGGMAAVSNTMRLVGSETEGAADAQKNLGTTIGIVSGLTAVQNALQKESNVMTAIRTLQTKAATRAEQLDTAAKKRNIVATTGATVAQRLFNLVAKANPYVLLALALVTVVGALIAFTAGANRAAKEQIKLNKAMAAELEYLDAIAEMRKSESNERVSQLQNELEVAKANNKSLDETRAIEDKIFQERVAAHDQAMKDYAAQVSQLDNNKLKLEQLYATLKRVKEEQAKGRKKVYIDIDGDLKVDKVDVDKAIDAVQGQIDNLGKSVKIGTELKAEGQALAAEQAKVIAQRRAEQQQIAKNETDILRAAQDARLALIQDNYKRESAAMKATATRQIEDINTRLRTEANLTKKSREALRAQQVSIAKKLEQDLLKLQQQYAALDLAARRETEDAEIALMAEGAEKQRKELQVSYTRQINDLTTALATQSDLTVTQREEMMKRIELLEKQYAQESEKLEKSIAASKLSADAERIQLRLDATKKGSQEEIDLTVELMKKQRDIELAENEQKAKELQQDEADIRAKWNKKILEETAKLERERAMMLLEAQQAQAKAEFDLLDRNARQKEIYSLQMEAARLQKLLDLDKKAAVKMTEQERAALQATLDAINKEIKSLPYNNLYELLGLNVSEKQQSALNEALSSIKDSLGSVIDSWKSVADAAVDAANKQVESTQKMLDAEIEARNNGYANEVEVARKRLDLAKKEQSKALAEQKKAQEAQERIDSLSQASSLVTAAANIWKAFSGTGFVGIAVAIAAIAAMFGSFAYSKIKAKEATSVKYGEGTVELLQGGSHASGHDIDLGTTRDGRRRRAEGGEYFAIINKRNSRRYRKEIPDVINALNDGTFAAKYHKAGDVMGGYAMGMIGGTDVSSIERDVAAIRRQGDTERYVDNGGNVIVRYKNLTRKILS